MKNIEVLDEYHIIDADGCLIDTDRLVDRAEMILNRSPYKSQCPDFREFIESNRGKSASVHSYLVERLEAGRLQKFYEEFSRVPVVDQLDFMLEGARDHLDYLERVHKPHGILTYGEEPWQSPKLKAAGVDHIPYRVTSQPHKGEEIASWRKDEGYYELPEEFSREFGGVAVARCLVFVDNSERAFTGFPEDGSGRGFWLGGDDSRLHTKSNVTAVEDWRSITEAEASRYRANA